MIFTLISTILWLGFVELLALGLLPFWCMLLNSGAEKVLGYSRVLSLLSLTWITWLFAQYGGAYFSIPLILLVTISLLATGHITLRQKFSSWRVFLYDQKLYRTYLSYAAALIILIIFRACSPEIFWGENASDVGGSGGTFKRASTKNKTSQNINRIFFFKLFQYPATISLVATCQCIYFKSVKVEQPGHTCTAHATTPAMHQYRCG